MRFTKQIFLSLIMVGLSAVAPALGQGLPTPDWGGYAMIDHSTPPTEAVYGNGWLFYAAGNFIYGRYASSGQLIAEPFNTAAKIGKAPALVQLGDGHWYVFVTNVAGILYKFDVEKSAANPGSTLQIAKAGGVSQIRSFRRPTDSGCLVKDSLTASPVLQLAAASNAEYSLGKDLVIVPSYDGCGSKTTNRITALDAADITSP